VKSELGGATAGAPSLHHVAVGTRDVESLAGFYARLLQTCERKRHVDAAGLRSIWLELAGALLMIERTESPPPAPAAGVGWGAFLLAFRADPSGRQAFEERARELGAAIESRSQFTSYLRDPDGNRIAVSEYEVSS
jgi:catechol 2,3-dioxygenase-like lactoylglutathione lyase family enzyme